MTSQPDNFENQEFAVETTADLELARDVELLFKDFPHSIDHDQESIIEQNIVLQLFYADEVPDNALPDMAEVSLHRFTAAVPISKSVSVNLTYDGQPGWQIFGYNEVSQLWRVVQVPADQHNLSEEQVRDSTAEEQRQRSEQMLINTSYELAFGESDPVTASDIEYLETVLGNGQPYMLIAPEEE